MPPAPRARPLPARRPPPTKLLALGRSVSVRVEAVGEAPRPLLHQTAPAAQAAGYTQASSVIPVVRSSEAASGTVTQSLTPSNESAPPCRPLAVHVAPEIVPVLPVPGEVRRGGAGAVVEAVGGDQPGRGRRAGVADRDADGDARPRVAGGVARDRRQGVGAVGDRAVVHETA